MRKHAQRRARQAARDGPASTWCVRRATTSAAKFGLALRRAKQLPLAHVPFAATQLKEYVGVLGAAPKYSRPTQNRT